MTKNILKTSAMAAAMLLCIGTAQAAPVTTVELVTNGGFETGDYTGWTQFPNGGSQAISGVNPSSGNWSSFQSTTGVAANSLIKAANVGIGIVTPGQQVEISFDMRGAVADGGVVFAEFFSELDGEGVSFAEILSGGPLFPNANPEVWTTYNFTVFAGPDVGGGVTLQLGAACGGAPSCVSDIYFDNASVTVEVAAVPVPAAVWLFGSGLLGLIGVARRKKAA